MEDIILKDNSRTIDTIQHQDVFRNPPCKLYILCQEDLRKGFLILRFFYWLKKGLRYIEGEAKDGNR